MLTQLRSPQDGSVQPAYVPGPQFSLYILLEGRCLQTRTRSECRIIAVETKGRQEMCTEDI